MKKESKKFILLGFSLTFSLGLFLFFFFLGGVDAANVNVNAVVPVSTTCGNGIKEGLEVCDDGNNTDCDGCKGDCSRADKVCGDGIKECGEACESAADCSGGGSCNLCICGVPCFLAGTEISLVGGLSLPIEKIKIGDLVISYNEETKGLEPSAVLKTFKHQASRYLFINQEIKVTFDHPLYINDQWLAAGQIKIGDKLLQEDGQAIIVSAIETKTGDFSVYNLEVNQNHNYFAQGYLAHNKGGCIPDCALRQCGPSNCPGISCGSCPAGQNCVGNQCVSSCGNGVIDAGEECDDGNTVSGDGCSAACELEVGCGNGILDPGEECDDNNIISGDCCSAVCKIELLIRNVTVSGITADSATLGWQTYSWQNNSCQLANTTSVLDWGRNIPPMEGTVSLVGSNFSHSISGLVVNTVYHFLITATTGSLQAIQSGSFKTIQPAEICDNNIDDDNDGLIDTLDPDCPCEAVYDCSDWLPAICPESGIQTRICEWTNQASCWNSQPAPETSRTCLPGECQLACGSCQSLNTESCQCEAISPCCGNGLCEPWAVPPENYESCPVDCPLECLPDWQCTAWGECINGIQTRQCYDQNACGTNLGRPDEIMGCTNECTISCPGVCHQLDIEQCICEEFIPCCGNLICESGENHQTCPIDCVEVCIPNWMPTGWSECINNQQTRSYQDLNNCPYTLLPPPDVRACSSDCQIPCGLCQKLDLPTCRCLPVSPCCGDRICEISQGENVNICAADCGLPSDLEITLTQCLDGSDNDNDGSIDYPADPDCSSPYDDSELGLLKFLQNIINHPQVQRSNKILAPALATLVVINAFTTFSFFNFLSYLQYLFTQPLLLLFRRKRKKWGVVYNSLSKQPVDLAIVRLYRRENNRLMQSRVTDKLGRYNFLVSAGRYYLTVTKPEFVFPTVFLFNVKEDVKYLDLYHGETIEVKEDNFNITYNIPIDPIEERRPVAKIIFQYYLRRLQKVVAFLAVPLAAISALISPGILTFTILVIHCLLFLLFYRLSYQRPPQSWGKVFDKLSRKPLVLALTRIYDKRYNKLLETHLTDARGRYSFLVNNNIYYLTAEKIGYRQFKSNDIDLVSQDRETIVDFNIGLERSKPEEKSSAETPIQPVVTPPASQTVIPAPGGKPTEPLIPPTEVGVSQDSLQNLLKAKQATIEVNEPAADRETKTPPLPEEDKATKPLLPEKPESVEKPPAEKSIFG